MSQHAQHTTAGALEAPSTLGRAVQRACTGIEGNLYDVGTGLTHGREAIVVASLHDAVHDARLVEAMTVVRRAVRDGTSAHARKVALLHIARLIVGAQHADAAEDGEILRCDDHLVTAQLSTRAAAGAIERLLVGRTRA